MCVRGKESTYREVYVWKWTKWSSHQKQLSDLFWWFQLLMPQSVLYSFRLHCTLWGCIMCINSDTDDHVIADALNVSHTTDCFLFNLHIRDGWWIIGKQLHTYKCFLFRCASGGRMQCPMRGYMNSCRFAYLVYDTDLW